MKISSDTIYSDNKLEVWLEPKEYEIFQRASMITLDIPWELGVKVKDITKSIDGQNIASRSQKLHSIIKYEPEKMRNLLYIACKCLDAISTIHEPGYIHGDINPSPEQRQKQITSSLLNFSCLVLVRLKLGNMEGRARDLCI
jgi:hypothetical protein